MAAVGPAGLRPEEPMMDGLGVNDEDCGRWDPLTGLGGHLERRLANHAG